MTIDSPERPVALLTQSTLFNLAGSETLTFELAQHLSTTGWEVLVGTCGYGRNWAGEFDALPNVRLLRFSEPELAHVIEARRPQIAWIHHQLIAPGLLEVQGDTSFVFNHMSEFHPLEFPYQSAVERELARLVAFTAPSTVDAQVSSGLLAGVDPQRFVVLGNPAPDAFWRDKPRPVSARPRILVASNHIPSELVDAFAGLSEHVDLSVIGLEGNKGATPERVTPELVAEHDAVITIGKTVQYALLSGIPAYVYDQFGGPGWLNDNVVGTARHHNFSGRGFGPKSAREIVTEVAGGFDEARGYAELAHATYAADFTWSAVWRRIEQSLEAVPAPTNRLSHRDIAQFRFTSDVVQSSLSIASHHESLSERLLREAAIVGAELNATRKELDAIRESRSFRAVSQVARARRRIQPRFGVVRLFDPRRANEWLSEMVHVKFRATRPFHRYLPGAKVPDGTERIVSMLRVRDEETLLPDTLDHLAKLSDAIVVFDDASTDRTAEIARAHPAVVQVIQNRRWRGRTREWEETANRRALHTWSKRLSPEWFVYSDADERFDEGIAEFLLGPEAEDITGVRVSLFDAYITEDDQEPYVQGMPLWGFRRRFGPERRDILMIWRNTPGVEYRGRDGREPQGVAGDIVTRFRCQHYGKALSIQHWEDTCDYYATHFPKYAEKWDARRGKAVHTVSDFDRELVPWDQVMEVGLHI